MKRKRFDIVDAIVFTVAVYVVTVAIQIYQPTTGGYFNLGESVIYLAALLRGPWIAGFAGGVGAALADVSTGYGIFAPGTLIIKFIEGLVAGFLVEHFRKTSGAILSIVVGGVYTILLLVFAMYYWVGEVFFGPETYLAWNITETFGSTTIYLPLTLWIILALVIGSATTYVLFKKYIHQSEALLLLVAGSLMVLGYFLYEYYISNPLMGIPSINALAEIPINIGQAVIGASIAIPVAGWLRRAGYGKQSTSSKY
ncbi:MAG: hypothetical protein B6U89_02945 [Desulfurococcales archaeon ex4484_58]|nr:MAG: hypothetical protein B6U89_02945 [Desulfurococcales archaeon ex4484_58]